MRDAKKPGNGKDNSDYGWLVLTRRPGQGLLLGKDVRVIISEVQVLSRNVVKVKVAVHAPKDHKIMRLEKVTPNPKLTQG